MKRLLERLQPLKAAVKSNLLYLDYGSCRHRIGSPQTDHSL